MISILCFQSAFDDMLRRVRKQEDIPEFVSIQKVLREEIVNPLRQKKLVRADNVMRLRELLDKLAFAKGLTTEEKGN